MRHPEWRTAARVPRAGREDRGRTTTTAMTAIALVWAGAAGGCDAEQVEPGGNGAREEWIELDSRRAGNSTASTPAEGETGVSERSVRFGQSAVMSGSAREVGRQVQVGIRAAFASVNRKGGIDGRRLELVALDDAYEPERAIANTRELIENEEVFALIGSTGTPTTRSAAPIARAAGVPYLAPVTGAAFLRAAEWTNVLHIRSSYEQEAEEIVRQFTTRMNIERVGILYQDDSFGRTGYRSVRLALERRGLEPAAIGIYARNTTAVKTALLDLRSGDVDAVVLIATFEPIMALVEWSRRLGVAPAFATLSIGGRDLLGESSAEGIYVAQVFPDPHDVGVGAVAAYQRGLAEYGGSTPGFHSLEGYLAGRVAAEGLARCGPAPTRACFIERLRAQPVDIEGLALNLGADDESPTDNVYLTRVGGEGRYEPVDGIGERP